MTSAGPDPSAVGPAFFSSGVWKSHAIVKSPFCSLREHFEAFASQAAKLTEIFYRIGMVHKTQSSRSMHPDVVYLFGGGGAKGAAWIKSSSKAGAG
jgi:hypothetical protein